MKLVKYSKQNPLKRSFDSLNSSQHEATEPMETDTTLTPSDYGRKVYEMAMRRNTIAVWDAGPGKNMFVVRMIKEIGKSLKDNDVGKRLIVFLAPTVYLAHQHYEEIKSQTELHVDEYYGGRGVDEWNQESWEKEINEQDVLIMTPQIFLNALRRSLLSFKSFCFIILDECHRATGKHPYARIMEEFYHKSSERPRILGMTALPMIRKDFLSVKYSKEHVAKLERLLDCRVYMMEDENKLEECIPSANPICRFYEPIQPANLELKAKLQCSLSKFDAVLIALQKYVPGQCKEAGGECSQLLDKMANDYTGVLFCLENLGLLCAHEAVKICIETAAKIQEEREVYKESIVQYENFLQEVLSIIEGAHEYKQLLSLRSGGSDTLSTGQISSKVLELLEIFRSFGKDQEALYFVFFEKLIAAKVIERVVKKIAAFSNLNILIYLTGSNGSTDRVPSKALKEVSESFCSGKVNLLFSTDVIEEDINVGKCSSVICFDFPKSVSSYAQSRGLARGKECQYIILLERGNKKQIEHVSNITKDRNRMICLAMNKETDDCQVKKAFTINEAFQYVVKSTGTSVTPDSSVSVIQRYCQNLFANNVSLEPKFEPSSDGNLYRCKLILPPNAAFETLVGPLACELHLARQLVCLEACTKLHMMGALDDHLLPHNVSSDKGCASNSKSLNSGAGTTKRKELHGSVTIRKLSGTWGGKPSCANFHACKMDFCCSIAEEIYSGFVLLLEMKLDDDVGNLEVDLYLLSKSVKATVSSCGQVYLDAQQMEKAKCFQELIFNGLFGKLFIKSTGGRELLLQAEESLWDPSNMYILLPLHDENTTSGQPLPINWTGIESCVSAVEFLRKNALLDLKLPERNDDPSVHMSESAVNKSDCEIIHLANTSATVDDLKEIVVIAIHTGRIYSILDTVADASSRSPFEGDVDLGYSSYADYYNKKYGIVLKYPDQPLVLLKQSHNSHNLLVDFQNEGPISKKKLKGCKKVVERKPQQHARMPPELLVSANIRTDILKSYYLLPSLMHRMEFLMLASQLREEISHRAGNSSIPSSLILEALTTQRCSESFSMERLELLGDSILKYAVSCHLYLKHPKKDEGELTSYRSRIICNSTLHKLGTNCKLQEYIRDVPFDSRRWTAPGQRSMWPSPCTHCVDTPEVPLGNSKFWSEDIKLTLGKPCDKGHRWLASKTISDCVEALIGAYYVGGGLSAAFGLMRWLGIELELERSLIEKAIRTGSIYSCLSIDEDIGSIESKIGYEFGTKGLLVEAVTHESKRERGIGYCYQRLEFLGDAVLDVLMTCHFYENHKNVDPGMLTDLRSASVNNDTFALAAVRHSLHLHLRHSSLHVENQVSSFIKFVSSMTTTYLTPATKGPKVLGDLVESIAGAVLIDSKLDLDQVWRVFKPLLSPIVTPDKLELPPTRELIELCDSLGYFIKEHISKGEIVHAVLKLQLEDVLLEGQGTGPNSKSAKGMAAMHLLKELESRGIKSSKSNKLESEYVDAQPSRGLVDNDMSQGSALKKQRQHKSLPKIKIACQSENAAPVLPPIETKKGGPRTALYALCKKQQWPMPSFETKEQKSRTLVQLGDTMGFNSFESRISFTIPDFGKIELTGEARADKKSSYDTAALQMLHELEKRGKIVIEKSN